MNRIILTLIISLNSFICKPQLQWSKVYNNFDERGIYQTLNEGYIQTGTYYTTDKENEIWVQKIDLNGKNEWTKTFGGSGNDEGHKVLQTMNGGYIIGGNTNSSNDYITNAKGENDILILKLDSAGNLQWSKCYGGSDFETFRDMVLLENGNFIICADSKSKDGDVISNHGGYDVFLFCLSPNGDIVWRKSIGGTKDDTPISIQKLDNQSFFLNGYSNSIDGDIMNEFYQGGTCLIKLDSNGNLLSHNNFDGIISFSFTTTKDGCIYISSMRNKYSNTLQGPDGSSDVYIVKMDKNLKVVFQKYYGGTRHDYPSSVIATDDNGIIFLATTDSKNGDVKSKYLYEKESIWIVKLDSLGNINWQKVLGGNSEDRATLICQTIDGGFAVLGNTGSMDGDLTNIKNDMLHSVWILKFRKQMLISDYKISNIYCADDSTGKIQIKVADKVSALKYLWTSVDTTQFLMNKPEGKYGISIVNVYNDTIKADFNITKKPIYNGTQICFVTSNGMYNVIHIDKGADNYNIYNLVHDKNK